MWKKIMITVLGVGTLGVGTVYAEQSMQTVYHVQMDGWEIGTVTEKAVVQDELESLVEQKEKEHEDWDMTVAEEITFNPERVFSVEADEEKVLERLQEDVSYAVEAVQVQVNGQSVSYLPEAGDVETVIDTLKAEYVNEEHVSDDEEVPAGETKLENVYVNGVIDYAPVKVAPSSIHTVEETVDRIQTGSMSEQVSLSSGEPLVDVIVTEQEREAEMIAHKVEVRNTDALYEGETEIHQEGQDGKKETLIQTVTENGETTEEEVLEEEVVEDPVTKVVLKGTRPSPSIGSGKFIWPAVGGTITSKQGERWGRYHKGIDIAGVSDLTIKAADHGKVTEAGYQESFGNKVVIDHGNGYETLYAHLSSIDVQVGDTVKQGDKLGDMGTTGHSTGVHLHFEVHKDGGLENPLSHVSQ
ncbi:peptidoglycan DD-metalloendopeptidase family protein [Halobacillus litoralis]|uniref:peptidoglycan DD-metalloendopeptidase family protein n=1 Tax=Halobacillus litoralis TaxID=45668 RepID=UPI00136A634C|nr:peptidoglycan DD-metalloendopeptidase family protein [Halobacillus litoralis]MYL39247.1 peptidoglycan DD-metalloendopeptidase family protein [Halobacillus litoralis]